jgi:N utilization substance protein A
VAKVVLDEEAERIEVVVPDEQLSLAIGRKGQNVRLASQLTGWDIDILTEAVESERRQKEFAERTNTFVNALNVDEMIAQLLVSEGFASVEELAFVEPQEVANIEGFDENTAQEIQERAREFLERQEAELTEKRRALGVEDALAEVEGLTASMLVTLGENGIKTVEDLADCATDELAGWQERAHGQTKQHAGILQSYNLAKADIEQLILNARVKAGWIEAPLPVEVSAGDDDSEGGEAPHAEPKEKAD